MRSQTTVGPLVTALQDESEDVRTAAARSLASIGGPEAMAALTSALADPSHWTASTVAADLIAMGPRAVPLLLEIVTQGAHDAAVTAVRVLGEIRDTRATPILLQMLTRSDDLNMRAQAAGALGKTGGPEVPAALVAALDDPAWQVRAQAANSLGTLGGDDAVTALARAIHDESWWVRRNCADALARLGERGLRMLVSLQSSSDPYVRDRCRAVLEALAAQRGARPAPPGPHATGPGQP
jgi:HEAT repeat protein